MFFELSKILGFFALPSNAAMTLGLAGGALMMTRHVRAGRRLAVTGLLLLAVLGYSPLANLLMLPLEHRFPPWNPAGRTPDGIVVLGGAVDPNGSAARGTISVDEAAERLTVMGELARRYPSARIVYSGGSGALMSRDAAEADFAVPLLESFGIARERIIAENRSRNTMENAQFSKDMAKPAAGERWLLVTSAYHMPRSIGVFRAVGFTVEAYPVDWRTRGPGDYKGLFSSPGDGLKRADAATREWVGLLVYWITGRTSELFPTP